MNEKIAVLPYDLNWGMSSADVKNNLLKHQFELLKNFEADQGSFYGTFDWKNAPDILHDADIIISPEDAMEDDLEFFCLMVFHNDERYLNSEGHFDFSDETFARIHTDQQAIFDYFTSLYGEPTDQGEKLDGTDPDNDPTTLYKAWAMDDAFITVAVDKIFDKDYYDEDEFADADNVFVLSISYSIEEE